VTVLAEKYQHGRNLYSLFLDEITPVENSLSTLRLSGSFLDLSRICTSHWDFPSLEYSLCDLVFNTELNSDLKVFPKLSPSFFFYSNGYRAFVLISWLTNCQ